MSWRAGLAAGCALVLATSALAGDDAPPPVSAAPPGYEDAMPRGPSVAERLAEIRRRIQDASRYPPIAREHGVAGETWVAFEIGADGRAKSLVTARSSGHGALDRGPLGGVEPAGRLPWVYGRVTVPVRFSLVAPEAE